jgi:hypothetical protein
MSPYLCIPHSSSSGVPNSPSPATGGANLAGSLGVGSAPRGAFGSGVASVGLVRATGASSTTVVETGVGARSAASSAGPPPAAAASVASASSGVSATYCSSSAVAASGAPGGTSAGSGAGMGVLSWSVSASSSTFSMIGEGSIAIGGASIIAWGSGAVDRLPTLETSSRSPARTTAKRRLATVVAAVSSGAAQTRRGRDDGTGRGRSATDGDRIKLLGIGT